VPVKSSKMSSSFLASLFLVVAISAGIAVASDTPDGYDNSATDGVFSSVIDPRVQEEMRKEQEKILREKAELHEQARFAAGNDHIKPIVEVLYQPKGCERKSINGDLMVVHYTGWLKSTKKKFDTTIDPRRRYAPFEFVLGTGYVIRGWDTGLQDMCPGEKRRMEVPPQIAYGNKGLRGVIPADATLIFLIELMDLRKTTPNYAPIDLFTSLDRDRDNHLNRDEISEYIRYQHNVYRNKNQPAPSPHEHERIVDSVMQNEDKDGDGVISHSEFSGPKIHTEL